MCGIAATVGIGDPAVFGRLFGAIRHRGPDESGALEAGRARLGCHRLAIVDPEGGRQPLVSADGRRLLVFNGEIYNHRALRDEFRGYGYRSGSDGEVLFPLLEREGPAGLRRLRGMFAFVLYDQATGEALAARDPFGIKPLYFMETAGGLAFASEMKSFLGLGGRLRFVPPGHYLLDGRLGRYYRPPRRGWVRRRPPLRPLLEEAVASHLPPDGPCGVLLSGGLDSSAVAALAARVRPDLTAYTVALPGAPDTERAEEVAAHLGIRHEVLRVSEEEARAALPPTIWYLESFHPVMVRNALPLYLVARRARRDAKVLLGGDGADELFAGYDYLATLERRFWPAAIESGVNNLHRTELQRADRITMANGVELRVPFLDAPLAEAALDLPLDDKVRLMDGRRVVKWALRAAVADLLPPSIVWRVKTPFADGSGFSRLGLDGGRADEETFREAWQSVYGEALSAAPIWADAGRYAGFEEQYGEPLLGLFRR
jgi:asparagine synthase (glutamine-hydrolysing)